MPRKLTLIYPDGKPHDVQAIDCARYEIDGRVCTILIYLDRGRECFTLLHEINGTMYKVPYHDFDLSRLRRIAPVDLNTLPPLISTVILREEVPEDQELPVLQEIANQTYQSAEWNDPAQAAVAIAAAPGGSSPPDGPKGPNGPHNYAYQTAVVFYEPPVHKLRYANSTPVYTKDLYVTYYYDILRRDTSPSDYVSIYEHKYGLYEHTPRKHTECFQKPLLFSEIAGAIRQYVYDHGQNINYNEELAPVTYQIETQPGATLADTIEMPDGRLMQVLLLVKPGIHRFNVHFAKCPYKKLATEAAKFEHREANILDDGTKDPGTTTENAYTAFREGFNLDRDIQIGNSTYHKADMSVFDFDDAYPGYNGSTSGYGRR